MAAPPRVAILVRCTGYLGKLAAPVSGAHGHSKLKGHNYIAPFCGKGGDFASIGIDDHPLCPFFCCVGQARQSSEIRVGTYCGCQCPGVPAPSLVAQVEPTASDRLPCWSASSCQSTVILREPAFFADWQKQICTWIKGPQRKQRAFQVLFTCQPNARVCCLAMWTELPLDSSL